MPKIALARIKIPPSRRPARNVEATAESIKEIGLQNPICIRPNGKGYTLVSGRNRLEACRLLGWKEIDCTVLMCGDLQARLAEIDENLIRDELSALERGECLAERKQIYEEMHPETKHGATGGGHTRDANLATLGFTDDTAEKTGRSARAIARDVQIAEDLSDEAKDILRETPIADNQSALAAIAKEDPDAQLAVAEMLASGEAATVAEAKAAIQSPTDDVVDGLDQPVPKAFREVFAQRKAFNELRRMIQQCEKKAEEVAAGVAGTYLVANAVKTDLGNARRQVTFAIPHCVCVYCDGKWKKERQECPACKGGGWMSKALYQSAPADLK